MISEYVYNNQYQYFLCRHLNMAEMVYFNIISMVLFKMKHLCKWDYVIIWNS